MEVLSVMKYVPKHEIHFSIMLYFILLLTCVVIFLKFAVRRIKYCRNVPSQTFRFWDVWGNISDIVSIGRIKQLSMNVYILQALSGCDQLFKNEKFFWFWLSFTPFLVVTRADAIEKLIAGTKNMEKGWIYNWLHPWLGTGLLTSHGSKWKSRRKLLTPAFHFDILKEFLPVFNEQSQLLTKLLRKRSEEPWIDITTPVTLCSLDIICETTLGVSIGAQKNSKSEYVQAILRTGEALMQRLLNPFHWIDWIFKFTTDGRQLKNDINLLHNFTRSIISSKKQKLLSKGDEAATQQKKRKALLDLLLEHHISTKSLTEEDIREEVDTFAFEGHDTTSMGMSWALYLIGLYPDVQENIHEELDRIFGDDCERPITTEDLSDMGYLERVLKESQRLYPSVPFFARHLNEDVILYGTKIPKGVTCLFISYCLHRNEAVFPNPEKFDPDRFLPENAVDRHPYAYVPFSAGPRNCIGQRFAVMEEKVIVANILRNYTLESLDPRDKVLPAAELILRAATPIRIKLRPRRA